jgi:hypothetical protein
MWREEKGSKATEVPGCREIAEKAMGDKWSTSSRMDRGIATALKLTNLIDDEREESCSNG